jgi:fluoride ion exporter CrcB/FEX
VQFGLIRARNIFIGGALGSVLRYTMFVVIGDMLLSEWAELIILFLVNLAGAAALGVMARHPYFQNAFCRDIWGVGFAGGFTTMSAVTVFIDSTMLTEWAVLMLILGLIVYGLGHKYGRSVARRAREAQEA